MNSTNYRLQELIDWRNGPRNYAIGLQLFINYSVGTHNTIASLQLNKDDAKLIKNIDWLISELKSETSNIPIADDKKTETPKGVEEKIEKLNSKFIFIQRELSQHHSMLKSMKTDAQRLSLIKSSIIPLDNQAMEIIERIKSLTTTGKDIIKRKPKAIVLTPANNTEQMKRYLTIPSTLNKTRKRIADYEQRLKSPLTAKENDKIIRALVKSKSTLELSLKEYNDLKKIFKNG